MLNQDEFLASLIEIQIKEDTDFLKIKETLTRIGIANRKTQTLWQSCHIFHKRNKLYIVHFKELFVLDGKRNDIDESDIARRNRIALLLEEWGLLKIKNPEMVKDLVAPIYHIKVISHKDKENWALQSKHSIGKKKF